MSHKVSMDEQTYHMTQADLTEEIQHGILVSNLSCQIARQMGLSEEMCRDVAIAGLLHDIGKLEMVKYVYRKADKEPMHVEKMRYARTHPALGYVILNEQGYPGNIAQWVLYHHENYDGSGYPGNKAGDAIPLGARILRVSDVFAALTADRAYRKAFDANTAVEMMIDEVKNFDMRVFLAFMNVIHEEKREAL